MVERGQRISTLAEAAVTRGADVIGMAGGDGSQAVVAAVAAEHDLPFVCVPAGTRNHFALDIGVDRDDVVGALDAFLHGSERRIDLARVNGRVFVKNVSMGLYGTIVQSQEYRDAKLRTVIEKLSELLGPGAEPFDLGFTDPNGSLYSGAQVLIVSNNRYELDPLGRRAREREWIKAPSVWSSYAVGPRSTDSRSGSHGRFGSTQGRRSRSDWMARRSCLIRPSSSSASRRPSGSESRYAGTTAIRQEVEHRLAHNERRGGTSEAPQRCVDRIEIEVLQVRRGRPATPRLGRH